MTRTTIPDSYDQNGGLRSVNTNGGLFYLTPDSEGRDTRFDFNTGPGQGTVLATEQYNGLGQRVFRHSADGQDRTLMIDGLPPDTV